RAQGPPRAQCARPPTALGQGANGSGRRRLREGRQEPVLVNFKQLVEYFEGKARSYDILFQAPEGSTVLTMGTESMPYCALLSEGVSTAMFFEADTLLLPDRNVINALKRKDGSRHDVPGERRLRAFVNDSRYMVSPVVAAFEGRHKSVPTFDEFCAD